MKFLLRFTVPNVTDHLIADFKRTREAQYKKTHPTYTDIDPRYNKETEDLAQKMLDTIADYIKADGVIHLQFDTEKDSVQVVKRGK